MKICSAVTINTGRRNRTSRSECGVERRMSYCLMGGKKSRITGYLGVFEIRFKSGSRTGGDSWNLLVIW